MAQEITLPSIVMRVVKPAAALNESILIPAQQVNMAGDAISARTQSIGTTAAGENVVLDAPVGTPGWGIFKNQGPTNYVEVGVQVSGAFYVFVKLLAGETSLPIRLGMAANAIYARANTAAVLLSHKIVEA
jgi:hypothetical protein